MDYLQASYDALFSILTMSAPSTPPHSQSAAGTAAHSDHSPMPHSSERDLDDEVDALGSAARLSVPSKLSPTNVRSLDASSTHSESESGDEDDVPRRARGGLASRMMVGQQGSSAAQNASSSESDGEGAYARIRRQLMGARPASATQSTSPEQADESDSARQPRKRKQFFNRRRVNRSSSPASQASRQSSPGLFVSPAKGTSAAELLDGDSDSDSLPSDPLRNKKILERIAKNRRARNEAEKAAKNRNDASDPITVPESDSNDEAAVEIRDKLTQQSRPTRKASKKALEEMQRETQRLSRSMQLGYQEKTRKRYSTKDLFKKFNYRQGGGETAQRETAHTDNEDTSGFDLAAGAMVSSDAEGLAVGEADTPPTSPASREDEALKDSSTSEVHLQSTLTTSEHAHANDSDNDELPDLNTLLTQPIEKVDKGKGRALDVQPIELRQESKARNIKVAVPKSITKGDEVMLDSDDDLDILPSKNNITSRLAVFDRMPAKKDQQSRPLLVQRALAHLTSPGKAPSKKRKGKPSISSAQLQNRLMLKAREQALLARQERLDALRAKGIFVLTEEEREKEQLQIENMLEKAREESRLLAKQEKGLRKGDDDDNNDRNEIDMMASSDEDENWVAENSDGEPMGSDGDDEEDQEELELSGSEDEEEEEEKEPNTAPRALFDDEADEDESEKEVEASRMKTVGHERTGTVDVENASDDEPLQRPVHSRTTQRRRQVIDEEDETAETPMKRQDARDPSQPDEMAAFGFAKTDESPVTFTQMFAGTMASMGSQDHEDSQASGDGIIDPDQDSLVFLRQLPVSTLPEFSALPDTQVGDSQTQAMSKETQESPAINLGLSQWHSQQQSLLSPSRFSEMPDPTQDAGFAFSQKLPAPPHSTTETVLVPVPESPIAEKKRGKLRKRKETSAVDSDSELDSAPATTHNHISTSRTRHDPLRAINDAFNVMRKASKKKKNDQASFDKKKSGAKNMVDEQAEESEDEYAGLGGASDDDSTGEVDEEVQKMMDDTHVEVDEREIAALLA